MMVASRLENGEEESAGMYNTSQSTAEESGNIDHEDNSSDKDSNKDMEAEESLLYGNLDLKLLTKDGRHGITVKFH